MNIPSPIRRAVLTLLLFLLPVATALAQTDPAVLKDLGTVIILQGHSCGKAVSAEKLGEDDYVVTCETGDRYRVTIDKATDRVVVRKQ